MRSIRRAVFWAILGAGMVWPQPNRESLALQDNPAPRWSPVDSGLPVKSFGVNFLAIDPVTPSTLYVLTNTGAMFKSTNAGADWQPSIGISRAWFLALAPNASALYAITTRGVVKSLDGGETWKNASTGLTGDAFSLVISPSDPSTLYAVTTRGLFKSASSGDDWSPASDQVDFSLVIDPTTPSTIYGLLSNRILGKSTDGGETWTAIRPDAMIDYPITSVAVDPANSSTIYAGYLPQSFTPGESPTGGVFKSVDGGKTWNAYQAGMPSTFFVTGLTIDPLTPSNVYAVITSNAGGGLVKSTDGGQIWSVVNDGLPGNFRGPLAIDPKTPSTIYAAGYQEGTGALFKSTQGGGKWQPSAAGLARVDARVVTIDPVKGNLYAGVSDAVFRSSDDGASWTNLRSFKIGEQPVPPGFPVPPYGAGTAAVHSILIDSVDPNVLYVRTTRADGACFFLDKLIFKSSDGGANWDDSVSPARSGCLLALGPSVMSIDPLNPDTLYLSEADDENEAYALLKSADAGAHWTSIWDYNSLQSALRAFATNPRNPGTLYAGVGEGYAGASASGVFKSTDGGATWNVTALKGAGANAMVIDPADPSILYAATEGIYTLPKGFQGLFKSTDSGATWVPAGNGLAGLTDIGAAITTLVIDPRHTSVLYAGTSGGGVFRSIDGAATWTQFNDGLSNLDIRALAIAPGSTSKIYAATSGGILGILDETPGQSGRPERAGK